MTDPMSDLTEEIHRLNKRIKTLGREKSNLEMAVSLIRQVSDTTGLADTVDRILEILVTAIGGSNITIYYESEGQWRYTDILGKKQWLDDIDDALVKDAVEQKTFLKEAEANESKLTIPGFPRTYETWVYPLKVKDSVFGALRLQGMAIENAHYRANIDPFIRYAAMVLFHEVSNIQRLRSSYQKVSQARKELEQTNQLLNSVIETSPQAIIAFDKDATITLWSASAVKMFGWKAAEACGRKAVDMICPDQKEHPDPFKAVLSGKHFADLEFQCMKKDTDFFDASLSLSPITDTAGNVQGGMAIIADITWRKRMEEQIRQAQKMESIGNLAGGIAHDFNNILFPIIGMSELLMEDHPQGSPEHEYADQIHKAGQRGGDLVQQILFFSRQYEHKMVPTHFQKILKEVLKLTRATIPVNIKISQEIQQDCGLLLADPIQLHQIAMNLITNAFHAVEQNGGEIRVQLTEIPLDGPDEAPDLPPGRYSCLSVSDTGCGIDKIILDKIFDPYFTTKKQGKGTGLGLAVVYGIIKEHRGSISVESEPGKGTVFKVYLPLMDGLAEPVPIEVKTVPKTGNERILIVDDEAPVVNLEKQILARLGYAVTAFDSSLEALERFRSQPHAFDLVITDMTMPAMTGDQFARALLRVRPDIPIIACTGFSERINENTAAEIGIRGLMIKPINKTDLAGLVRRVLDEKKKTGTK